MFRRFCAAAVVATAFALPAVPVLACGGLVAPDGDVHLDQATTFVAWHGGVEHYLTSFAYQGSATNLGWIVPLPAVPDSIQPGGQWTLQRLERETHPLRFEAAAAGAPAGAALDAPAQVLEQTQVEALDITVIKGSGQAIVDWCAQNGFLLPSETRDHLLDYAKASPIFMAAKYDAAAAAARNQFVGDGAPVLITMHTPNLWVPLEILANDDSAVNADLYLMTDGPVTTGTEPLLFGSSVGRQLPGAPGFTLTEQEPVNQSLLTDLSSDRNMGWVPAGAWLTYLHLGAPGSQVNYDLAVDQGGAIRLAPLGTPPSAAATQAPKAPYAPTRAVVDAGVAWTAAAVALLALGIGSMAWVVLHQRRTPLPG